jgi:hypothetical protein
MVYEEPCLSNRLNTGLETNLKLLPTLCLKLCEMFFYTSLEYIRLFNILISIKDGVS